MSEPIVMISNQRIREGKLADYKQFSRKVAELLEASRPGTVAFLPYLNEGGAEASIVYVFADAVSMEAHLQTAGDLAKESFELMEIISLEVYGMVTDKTMESMKKIAGSGATVTTKPELLAGFVRLKAK